MGLSADTLSVMARVDGSNVVAACNLWGIEHIGCIGHSLHLVVNPFLQEKKKKKMRAVMKQPGIKMKVQILMIWMMMMKMF